MSDLSDQRQVPVNVSIRDELFTYWHDFLCFLLMWNLYNFFCKIQDAQRLAESWGVPYVECSSKTGENVADVFHTLLKEIEKDDGLLKEDEENGCIIL